MITFILVVNNQGQPRIVKYFPFALWESATSIAKSDKVKASGSVNNTNTSHSDSVSASGVGVSEPVTVSATGTDSRKKQEIDIIKKCLCRSDKEVIVVYDNYEQGTYKYNYDMSYYIRLSLA